MRKAYYSMRRAYYSVRRAYYSMRRACYSVRRLIPACVGLFQYAQSLRRACARPVHGAYITPAKDLAESRENSDQKLRVLIGGF